MPTLNLPLNCVDSDAGACAARGFLAAGVAAGIKASGKPDMALIFSERPASLAALFTGNLACAAPVVVSRRHAAGGQGRGVIVNSGGANAGTGAAGLADARRMAEATAQLMGVPTEQIQVCSTGLIGTPLPMDRVLRGIELAAAALGTGVDAAARAIMTTDTVLKKAALVHRNGWAIGGICKGAGMIAPNMATMLAFITTDASVSPEPLYRYLQEAAEVSFNSISVDGDTSTNDTVLLFANGLSGLEPAAQDFAAGLEWVCRSLARQIVADAEGASKLVTVTVTGAASVVEARRAARTVAESLLVKTMLYGGDANWGRIAAAIGRAGVHVDMDQLSIDMCGVRLLNRSVPAAVQEVERARRALAAWEVNIECDLASGGARAQMLTCDLTPGYVTFNAEYEA
ncbi:MAG: bifunctional glutamate N-acetyltransferase/amino-acid acetyltransferase ArgJ [Actinomycetota bacterium]